LPKIVLVDLATVGAEYPPTPTLKQVQTIIDRRGPSGLKAFDPIWLAGFRIDGRKVSDYHWGARSSSAMLPMFMVPREGRG
jgi:hypothetical protein